jgi:hypothetical protein
MPLITLAIPYRLRRLDARLRRSGEGRGAAYLGR